MKVYVLLAGWLCMVTWVPHCDGGKAKLRNKFKSLKNPFSGAIKNTEVIPQDVSIALSLDGTGSAAFVDMIEVAPPQPPERKPELKPAPRPPPRPAKRPVQNQALRPAHRQGRPAPKPAESQAPRQAARPTQRLAPKPASRPDQGQAPRPASIPTKQQAKPAPRQGLKPARKPAATRTEVKVSTKKTPKRFQGIKPRKRKRQQTRNNRLPAKRNQAAQNTAPKPPQQTTGQKPSVSSFNRQQIRQQRIPVIKRIISEEKKPLSITPQGNSNTAQQSQPTKRTLQGSSVLINSLKPAAKDTRPKSRPQIPKCPKVQKPAFDFMKNPSDFDRRVLTPALTLFKDVEECRNTEFHKHLLYLLQYRTDTFGI